jgi:O-glycosyl hydrolase
MKHTKNTTRALLGCALAVIPTAAMTSQPAVAQTATISSTASQEVKGWGFYPSYHHHDWGTDFQILTRNDVQNALYIESGITHIRCELRAVYGDGNGVLNTTRLKDLVDHIKAAKAKNSNLKYMLSIWSPPAGMKTPAITNGKDANGNPTQLRTDKESTFCTYVANAIQHLNNNGAGLPVALSVQNESRSAVSWDGCVYGADQFRRVTKLMRTTLNNYGFSSVGILAAEGAVYEDNEALLGAGFSALGSDSALNSAIAGFATHSYDQWNNDDSADYTRMTNFRSAVSGKGKNLWMTEWSIPNGSTQLDWTIQTAMHFNREMAVLPTNYWFWWRGWTKGTTHNSEDLLRGDATASRSKLFYFFKKVWNTVRPGWRVKKMSSSNTAWRGDNNLYVNMVAFENSGGTQSCVILVNESTTSRTLTVSGLKGTWVNVTRTSSSEDQAYITGSSIAGSYTASLPARSITVLASG